MPRQEDSSEVGSRKSDRSNGSSRSSKSRSSSDGNVGDSNNDVKGSVTVAPPPDSTSSGNVSNGSGPRRHDGDKKDSTSTSCSGKMKDKKEKKDNKKHKKEKKEKKEKKTSQHNHHKKRTREDDSASSDSGESEGMEEGGREGAKKHRRKEEKDEREERRLVKEAMKYLEKHGGSGGGGGSSSSSSKSKSKSKSSSSSSSKDKKEKEKKKRKRREEKMKGNAASPARPIPEVLHAVDDYYRRQVEFRVWLRLVKRINFETLTREKAQEHFDRFVSTWNKGLLPDMYYDGVPVHVQTEAHKTGHVWGFAKKMSDGEKDALERMANSIVRTTTGEGGGRGMTSLNSSGTGSHNHMPPPERPTSSSSSSSSSAHHLALTGTRDRERKALIIEENVPKATGREAQLAARHAKGERMHGAARAKEEGRYGLELSEAALGIGGRDVEGEEMRRRLARQKELGNQRQQEQKERMEEAARKEKDAMQKLFDTLGLKPGQRITIPKRTTE